jgi:riboflavin biosynthesis pyrimidine reductase
MPRSKKVPTIRDFVKALKKLREIKVQKTCTDNGEELYGFQELDKIGIAIRTCMIDGGPDLAVSVLIHELVHYINPNLSEEEVNEVTEECMRSYKLRYMCALELIYALSRKAGLI